MGFDKKIVRCADDVKDCFAALYGECSAAQLARYEKLIARFKAETGKTGYMASSSGRVEVIGNHTDHNGGVAWAARSASIRSRCFCPKKTA